jgi:hypothetical protein
MTTTRVRKPTKPNPQALAEFQEVFLNWLVRRELQKRAQRLAKPPVLRRPQVKV